MEEKNLCALDADYLGCRPAREQEVVKMVFYRTDSGVEAAGRRVVRVPINYVIAAEAWIEACQ
jgi:hypothetical protein